MISLTTTVTYSDLYRSLTTSSASMQDIYLAFDIACWKIFTPKIHKATKPAFNAGPSWRFAGGPMMARFCGIWILSLLTN